VVANPAQIKLIAASAMKTDKREPLALARLLVANLIPAVWVPHQRYASLGHLSPTASACSSNAAWPKIVCRGGSHQHKLPSPATDAFTPIHQTWWERLEQHLPPPERLRAQQDRALVVSLTTLIETVEAELARVRKPEPWKAQVPFLIQLPGIGLITVMTVLAPVSESTRFASAKHLVGYAGLGASVHASGQVHRAGSITRSRRSEFRTILVEAAWTAVRISAWWRPRYAQLTAPMPPAKAIVAIARKLLVVIWHVLTARTADRQADPGAVARRLFRWGAGHHLATRSGLSRDAFVRKALEQIGLGQDLTHLAIDGSTFVLRTSG
jgi:transposase